MFSGNSKSLNKLKIMDIPVVTKMRFRPFHAKILTKKHSTFDKLDAK